MADLDKIVEELSTLSVLEAAELSKLLEEKCALMSLLVAKKMVDNSKAQNEVDTTQKTILQIAE